MKKIEILDYKTQAGKVKKRCEKNLASFEKELAVVREILQDVRKRKNRAVKECTSKFDGVELKSLLVPEKKFAESEKLLDAPQKAAIKLAIRRIQDYHKHQREKGWKYTSPLGSKFEQAVYPLDSAGIHVPAGGAPLPSTLIMCAVPAKLAGVKRLAVISPPRFEGSVYPEILYVARRLGIEEVYAIGGAQGIGALAYGTETIRPVDKIVGPGNIYVQLAKKEVYGTTGIDMVAGPSEVLIVADKTAPADLAAADIIAQAEHGFDGRTYLFTDSLNVAKAVQAELALQTNASPRKQILEKSLPGFCTLVVFENLEQCIPLANMVAPEHAQIMAAKPERIVKRLNVVGSMFVGKWSPAAAGDYLSGSNHVLPTNGAARFSSPLCVNDFYRKTSITQLSRREFDEIGPHIANFAKMELLEGHAQTIKKRLER